MILALRLNLGTALVMALAAAPTTLLAAQAPTASKAAPAPKATPSNVDADDDDAEVSEVVITGTRPQPGEVLGDIKPEIQLSPADVQSYGVSNISDLIDELAPLTRSAKGDDGPVILLNGRRISSFYEIRDLPTEAILRVDILPEEAALKFGYSADQRVINIVLRRRFRAITAELRGTTPTEGGQLSGEADTDIVRIRGDNRFSLNLNYQQSTALTENERNLVSQSSSQPFDLIGNVLPSLNGTDIDPALSALAGRPVTIAGVPAGVTGRALTLSDFLATAGTGNVSDIRRYRTLSPATKEISSNIVYARTLPWGLSATVNANLNASQSDSMLGLPSFNLLVPQGDPFSPFSQPVNVARYVDGMGALQQDTKTWTAHLGGTVNRNAGKWRLQMTANYDHADTITVGDSGLDTTLLQTLITADSPTVDPFAVLPVTLLPARPDDKARSISDATNVTFLFNGPIMRIPAGNITTSIRMGDAQSWFDTNSFRRGVSQSADLSRNDLNGQISIDLPIASRKQLFLPAAGELSVNLNLAAHQLSDFGALTTIGYGVNWTPITGVSFNVSRTQDEGAPTVQQLGNPLVVTPGSRILDFRTGQTVEISRIDGGSPGLTSNHRDVMKIGMTLKPLSKEDFVITASFATTRTRNPIQTLPAATAEIEAAFPDRFIRDASGQLVEVDYRPVNFARQDRQELRWGFNYSRPVGPQPTPRANFEGGQRPRGPRANAPGQTGQAAAPAPAPDGTQPNAAAWPVWPGALARGPRGR